MGRKDDRDDDERGPRDLAGSQIDADKRRNVVSRSRSSTDSVSSTIDIAAITRSLGDGIDRATAGLRLSFEIQQTALKEARDENNALRVANAGLIVELRQVAEQNVNFILLKGQAQNNDTEIREKNETLRHGISSIAAAFGPAAGPLLTLAWTKLAPKFGLPPAPGATSSDATPKAAAQRFAVKLQNGSEDSLGLLSVLADFVGAEDVPLLLGFLSEVTADPPPAPPPAEPPATVTPPPVYDPAAVDRHLAPPAAPKTPRKRKGLAS
jgi:hypothetical protein